MRLNWKPGCQKNIFLSKWSNEIRNNMFIRQNYIGIKEHQDINMLLGLVRKTSPAARLERESYRLQLISLLSTHFQKEEDAVFPLAEKVLDLEGLNQLGAEMKARQTEVRDLLKE